MWLNEKGSALMAIWKVFAGIMLFGIWIMLWTPIIAIYLDFINDPANAVPNAVLMVSIISLIPLIFLIKIIVGSFMEEREPQGYYKEYSPYAGPPQAPPPPGGSFREAEESLW